MMGLLISVATCGACSSPTPSATVTGIAEPCVGALPVAHSYRDIPVRVVLFQTTREVANEVVTGSHTFRFSVAPGAYVVTSNQATVRGQSFALRPRQVGHVDLLTLCK